MKFLLITYRWHRDLIGGAELHHRRLARELLDAGNEVAVLTTTGGAIHPFAHWGVEWREDFRPGQEDDEGIPVTRVPLRRRHRWLQAWDAKALQRRHEAEERGPVREWCGERLPRIAGETAAIHLLEGWNHPEVHEGRAIRWSGGRARFVVAPGAGGTIRIGGHKPKAGRIRILRDPSGIVLDLARPEGWLDLEFEHAPTSQPTVYTLEVEPAWRPLRDFRTLGLQVHHLAIDDTAEADMNEDYRSLARRTGDDWMDRLVHQALRRPARYSRMIDRLRGPIAPALQRERDDPRFRNHVVIHCNLPWATMSSVRPGDLAMPLWHVDDQFYAWRHWIGGLRRARFVLANTPFAARSFYPRHGIRAHFVGPPIWPAEASITGGAARAFRRSHRIDDGEFLVLTVCRKSSEKRYEAIAAAVEQARARGAAMRFLGVGPDTDGRPLQRDGAAWIGPLTGEDLQAAYAACDAFVLMSESESFGMVIPEAWHHGRPVVVNRWCAPAASLVDEGADGLLAGPGTELVDALMRLYGDRDLVRLLGEAGREKARRDFVRGAAAQRLLSAVAADQASR